MPTILNFNKIPVSERDTSLEPYQWLASENLGEAINLEDFVCNIRQLPQGKYSYPYHYHHNAEEIFVILSGEGQIRTEKGLTNVKTGDIGLFEKGLDGAHQLYNPHEEPLVYLDLRTLKSIDVCEYPDTGKINILPQRDIFARGDAMSYFEGEEEVDQVWDEMRGIHGEKK